MPKKTQVCINKKGNEEMVKTVSAFNHAAAVFLPWRFAGCKVRVEVLKE